eukprot:scaffold133_cov103-Isochrysis_galbana.AAC.2
MVDIDEDVVAFCKQHLPENESAFNDKRFELIIDDAKARRRHRTQPSPPSPTPRGTPRNTHSPSSDCFLLAVLEKEGTFDVIIMDLDDPLEGGPCYQLYTTEFYAMLKQHLNPGGIFITQVGETIPRLPHQASLSRPIPPHP